VRGAKQHNLKNVDITLPKKKLIVFTGVSGSGKSSLAFDTILAEGQRRYVESLSSYARQFLGQMDKPKFETIRGLSPTISIEQKSASKNPRSTVGTITEVYDYLRVLYARVGVQYCHICSKEVGRGDASTMVKQIEKMPVGTKFLLLSPVVQNRKGEHKDKFDELKSAGYHRVRIDGVIHKLQDITGLAKNKKHNIEVVVDRLIRKNGKEHKSRLQDSVETALKLGHGQMILHIIGREDLLMSEHRSCCGFAFPQLDPPLFSFNAPQGMCQSCNGLGTIVGMDENKIIPDKTLSIREGAVVPWRTYFLKGEDDESWSGERFQAMQEQWSIDFDKPWVKLPKKLQRLILSGGNKAELTMGDWSYEWEGLLNSMMRRYLNTKSDFMKTYYQKFMSSSSCKSCEGRRLKSDVLNVKVMDKNIMQLCELNIQEAYEFICNIELKGQKRVIAEDLVKEIQSRLKFLVGVGLDYLSLDRKGPTLSGGEAQRIRLASQIGSELTGVLYILDEPSIGLHQRDNKKLLNTLAHLRDIGNTLIVVEHDQETIETADWVVDIGPGAGHLGGQIVASGTPKDISRNSLSLTGQYLKGQKTIEVPEFRRLPYESDDAFIEICGASGNNLRKVSTKIPIGLFTAVTGVSGAGKSTLINQVLYPACMRHLHDSSMEVAPYEKISGLSEIDKIINIDQKAIGRTPRSNPATYTKLFDLVRDLFAQLPEAKARGYKKGRFSFNVKGGRCEPCQGDGLLKVEMHFLSDVYVPCEVCQGRRFNEATLEIRFKDHSIADVLDLSVAQSMDLFQNQPKIKYILQTLMDVGLSYVKLGQSATTLSGGEAQRIKLARELAKKASGRTLYILDEPTTGLHFDDVFKLLSVLQRLVDSGNTIIVIEHNLDVIKSADWIIDMGPEGGHGGGSIVAEGAPEDIVDVKGSYTAYYLKKILQH